MRLFRGWPMIAGKSEGIRLHSPSDATVPYRRQRPDLANSVRVETVSQHTSTAAYIGGYRAADEASDRDEVRDTAGLGHFDR